MSPKLYRLYRLVTIIKQKMYRKVSTTGRLVALFAILSLLFGVNTRLTMIYQLAAISVMLVAVALPLSLFFQPRVRVRRVLPPTCTVGESLCYYLQLENETENRLSGLHYHELSGAKLPSYEEFTTMAEEGEADRNFFDRKLGYYRWLWLVRRAQGANFRASSLPALEPGEARRVEVCFTPLRRGYISLSGHYIYLLEPLGLFKKGKVSTDAEKVLALPKLYPVTQVDLAGSRKYHQGGLSGTMSYGDTGEFVSLREYHPGDHVKHIDWKATARSGEPIVRQYQDEYFSRFGIVVDTFSTNAPEQVFEDAISVAASLIVQQDNTKNLIDLLFAGDTCISNISAGHGQSTRLSMLEVLACISPCRSKSFSDLREVVIAHTVFLSGLVIVLIDLDQERSNLIRYLDASGIANTVLLVTADLETSKQRMQDYGMTDIVLFDVNSSPKVVKV